MPDWITLRLTRFGARGVDAGPARYHHSGVGNIVEYSCGARRASPAGAGVHHAAHAGSPRGVRLARSAGPALGSRSRLGSAPAMRQSYGARFTPGRRRPRRPRKPQNQQSRPETLSSIRLSVAFRYSNTSSIPRPDGLISGSIIWIVVRSQRIRHPLPDRIVFRARGDLSPNHLSGDLAESHGHKSLDPKLGEASEA
jgi:hypothetical protein